MSETTPQTGEHEPTGQEPERPGALRLGQVRIGAVIAIAIAAGLIIWALIGGRGGGGSSSTTNATGPVALSYGGLTELAGALKQPIYWVGPRGGMRYELQQLGDGKVYVRYLPSGVDAGDSGTHLTVGTYPMSEAYSVTSSYATAEGSTQLQAGDGAVAFTSSSNPTSAYVAFPRSDYQIEVYDPTSGTARQLVGRGAVAQVPTNTPTKARAITPQALKRLSASIAQPIYWAGRAPGVTYEVSQNTGASVYVRYVPSGVEVGDPRELKTVATYPLTGAYDQTKALADQSGMELIKLKGGGIAVFPKGAAKHGYVAYPDVDYQVEVFDPVPGAARKLVTAGHISVIG